MKVQLDYKTFYNICISLAEEIKKYNPDEIVSVMRGGMSASHIISKYLNLPCGTFIPKKPNLILNNNETKKIVLIEDLIAEGRTLNIIKQYFSLLSYEWKLVPFLIDDKFNDQDNSILTYGLKTKHWIVMPYEEIDHMKENDRGLFREGSDKYGK